MKKIVVFLALAVVMVGAALAQDLKKDVENDLKFFTDPSCSQLKTKIRNTKQFQSELLRGVANRMLDGKYEYDYIVAEYEAYPSPIVIKNELKLGDGFSKYENMTGVYLDAGENVVLVGETGGRKISLLLPNLMRKPDKGVEPTKDPNGWHLHKQVIPLQEGVNVINVKVATNAYISYFESDYANAPKIKVHFPTGRVNGYFDLTKDNNNDDWDRLLEKAVGPIMDARGKYIQVAYPVEWFKRFTKGRGVELLEAYDTMIGLQYEIMGLKKYDRIPKNRIFARVNFNYYMFRDVDGVAYLGDENTMRMVSVPEVVTKGDPCWGFSHEVGHVMQMRPMTWGGMTEVSNNIFSLYVNTTLGTPSRIKLQNNYQKARESIIDQGISYLQDPDPFNRLVPFWQLHLYFESKGYSEFYADVMEKLRKMVFVPEGNMSIYNQFNFIETCCDVTKTDLTEFFEKWGFFYVGEIELNDYGKYTYKITQKMVDKCKLNIASKGYSKPDADLTKVTDLGTYIRAL